MTMSLDGFVAGPNVDLARPFGDGGKCLHNWLFGDGTNAPSETDRQVSREMFSPTGAFIMGRRTFEVGEEPWGDDGAFGMPCFVLTHRSKAKLVKGPTSFTFFTEGIGKCLEQARAAAGGKDVCIMGGASAAQQYLTAGLVEEMRIHLAPYLLGQGTRLFDYIGTEPVRLELTRVMESPFATHLNFRVVR
jgi:dihydrofolate reductase